MNEYKHSVKIRNKNIRFRKWKIKDKKKFTSIIKKEDVDIHEAQQVLVYDCLEDQSIVLSADEFRYVITAIRKESITSDVNFSYDCDDCSEENNKVLNILDIVTFKVKDYKNIKSTNIDIELSDVINKEFYNKKIKECTEPEEEYIVDFLYRIKSLNGNQDFTFDEMTSFFDELDVDVAEEILTQWNEQRFLIDDTIQLTCEKCQNKEDFSFDEIPDFFPASWF